MSVPRISYDWMSPAVSVTTEATNYPKENLLDRRDTPYNKEWRSIVTTQTDIELDFGGAHTLEALVLLNVNFATFQILEGTTLSALSEISGSPFTPAKYVDGYYNYIHIASLTDRFVIVRILNATTRFDSAAYYSIGSLQVLDSITDFPIGPAQDMQEEVTREYHTVGNDKGAAGPFRIKRTMDFIVANGSEGVYEDLNLEGEDSPFIFFDNLGNNEEVSLGRLDGRVSIRRRSTTRRINMIYRSMP